MSIVDFDQTKLTRLSLKSVPLAFSLTPRASQKQSIPKCRDLIRWYRPRTDDAQPTHAQKLVIRPNRAARPMRNSICGEDVRGLRDARHRKLISIKVQKINFGYWLNGRNGSEYFQSDFQ